MHECIVSNTVVQETEDGNDGEVERDVEEEEGLDEEDEEGQKMVDEINVEGCVGVEGEGAEELVRTECEHCPKEECDYELECEHGAEEVAEECVEIEELEYEEEHGEVHAEDGEVLEAAERLRAEVCGEGLRQGVVGEGVCAEEECCDADEFKCHFLLMCDCN